jgi:disulfide bond formation protein DsbB
MTSRLAIKLNALALYAISGVLVGAFYFQFAMHELPCPLCLLQRIGFVALAFGPMLTLRYGPRPSHYGYLILAGAVGAMIAMRQVLLHIAPGDPGYGSVFMGYHFYTWAFVCFVVGIVASAVMLCFDGQFEAGESVPEIGLFERTAVWLVIALTLANLAGVLLQCGFGECPSDPVHYELLSPFS